MALNLTLKPFQCVNTAMGELCIFAITIGNQGDLYKSLGKPVDKCDPEHYMRQLIPYISCQKTQLIQGQFKPALPVLSINETSSLTNEDLELIAKTYIEHNEYLFKEKLREEHKNDKGEMVIHYSYGNVKYPKIDGETYVQYLHRLTIRHEEELAEIIRAAMGPISELKNFSSQLGESIKSTLAFGDSLKKSWENIQLLHKPPAIFHEPIAPRIDWDRIAEERVRPFNELAERLDQLIDVSARATEFMIEANRIQTRIAGEVKSSGDDAKNYSRSNIYLGIAVIILTILSIGIPLYMDRNSNEAQQPIIQKHFGTLSSQLSDINNSIKAGNSEKPLREENNKLKQIADKQNLTIKKLQQHNIQLERRIEVLEKRIKRTD